jgi:hypothetical protein
MLPLSRTLSAGCPMLCCFLFPQNTLLPFLVPCHMCCHRCVVLRAICYQYFLSGFIFLNKANPAAVKTCPVCCMRALMACRFLSTLSRLLIFLIGDGDIALDVVGNVARDDAWDDVGVVAFNDVDTCSSAYISALMVFIILCCFSLCCMSDCLILSLFFSHSSAIWCLSHWFRLPVTLSLSLIPGVLYLARFVSILGCFRCCGCASWSGCGHPFSSSLLGSWCWLPVLSCCPLCAPPLLPAKKLPPMLTS